MRSLERWLASEESWSRVEQVQQEVTEAGFGASLGELPAVPSVGDVSEDPALGYQLTPLAFKGVGF